MGRSPTTIREGSAGRTGPGQLTDGVVVLTVFRKDDAALLSEADEDHEHRRRFDFPEGFTPSVAHSERVVARWEQERMEGARYALAVRDADTGQLVGGCEIQQGDRDVAALSYWTLSGSRGRGFATRAVRLSCAYAFDELGFEHLEILTDRDNHASRRVALKAGFEEVGQRDGRILHLLSAPRTREAR